jgi:hypothetical protein
LQEWLQGGLQPLPYAGAPVASGRATVLATAKPLNTNV